MRLPTIITSPISTVQRLTPSPSLKKPHPNHHHRIQQSNEILLELSGHANKPSEVQAMPEVTKEYGQVSFAVANAVKGLMKL